MKPAFWTNTIWYVLLGFLTLIELVCSICIAKRRRLTFAFYQTVVGITLFFETLILIFLGSYSYYPMILNKHSDPFNDSLAGNLFSQFSVSSSVLLVVILDLKYYWYIIFGLIYGIIEEFFISLGVYSHNWYRTWMTVVAFPILTLIAKKLYLKILKGVKPTAYFLYIYMGLFSLYVITLLWGLDLTGFMQFTSTLFNSAKISRYSLYLMYYSVSSAALMLIYFLRTKFRYKALIIIVLYAIYFIGYKLDLIHFKEGWFWAVTALTVIWLYLSIFLLDKLYGGPQRKV